MERRKFLIGMGSLAAGSAAALGTGAVDSVDAERDVGINKAGDASAYLRLSAGNSPYVTNDNSGTLTINLGGPDVNPGGSGFNENAATVIERAFTIENQGTDPVSISLEYSGDGGVFTSGDIDEVNLDTTEGVYFDLDDDASDDDLGSGEKIQVDAAVVIEGTDDDIDLGDLTIHAEATST